MKLYQFPHSPYCIPISLILKNCSVDFEEVLVPNWDRGMVSRLTNGAYYQVPVIEHEGEVVFESSSSSLDVARYVSHFSKIDLFPQSISGIHELVIEHIESEIEGIGFKTVDPQYIDSIEDITNKTGVIRHKERFYGRGCIEQWREDKVKLLKQFHNEVDRFKGVIESNGFLFRDTPVYADYALYGVIGNVNYIPGNLNLEGRRWLSDWMQRLEHFDLSKR